MVRSCDRQPVRRRVGGILSNYGSCEPEGIASLSRGYGLSVTPLQLAQAYAAIGAGGVMRPVTMLRRNELVAGELVISARSARTLIGMLESVVVDGTGTKAAIPGYRVAGKTGTALKSNGSGGYYEDRYTAHIRWPGAGEQPASGCSGGDR